MSSISRVPLMIVSFLLSLMLWIYVQVQENPTRPLRTSYTVQIELKNVPEDLWVRQPDPIRIFPVGPLDELQRIDPADLSAFIDLTGAKAGENVLPVRLSIKGDYSVRWEPRSPTARVAIERKKTRAVRVVIQPAGQLTNPNLVYLAESTYTEPAAITISGPETDVDNVAYARAILDLTTVNAGKTYSSEIDLVQAGDRPAASTVEPEVRRVNIRPGVGVADARLVFVQPILIGQPANGYSVKSIEVTPEQVQLRGRAESLSSLFIAGVRTQSIDIAGIKETTSFSTNLVLPPDVTAGASSTVSVRVILAGPPTPKAQPPKKPGRRDGG